MKSQNELQENNKIIAEFMGGVVVNGSEIFFDLSLFEYVLYTKPIPFDELFYHNDWNWLIHVVEFIKESHPFITFDLSFLGCEIKIVDFANDNRLLFKTNPKMNTHEAIMIDCVYNAVLNYIHWQNEQKK